MKVFFLKLFIISVTTVAFIGAINYSVDPALVFHGGAYERAVAEAMLDGRKYTITTNYDERLMKKLYITEFFNRGMFPDCLLAGSSRLEMVGLVGEVFGAQTGLSCSVSGMALEDMIALIGICDNTGTLPKKVILGIDPWLFNEKHGDTRYLSILEEYHAACLKMGIPIYESTPQANPLIWKTKELFSLTYFQSSIKDIHHRPPTLEYVDEADTKPIAESLPLSIEDINNEVRETIRSGYIYHLEGYDKLSLRHIKAFDCFIQYLKSQDIEIIFVLTPYHPIMYDYLSSNEKYARLHEVETYMREYAIQNDICVIGSYDPDLAGATDADFRDFMHPHAIFTWQMCRDAYMV